MELSTRVRARPRDDRAPADQQGRRPARADLAPALRWLSVERFEYERVDNSSAVLRLLGIFDADLGAPAGATLVVYNGLSSTAHPSFAGERCCCARTRDAGPTSELLWRASFELSLEVVEYPYALFKLSADGRLPIALPAPTAAFIERLEASRSGPYWGARIRQHLVALAAVAAVAAASGSAANLAAADTLVSHASSPTATAVAAPFTTAAGGATAPAYETTTTTITTITTSTNTRPRPRRSGVKSIPAIPTTPKRDQTPAATGSHWSHRRWAAIGQWSQSHPDSHHGHPRRSSQVDRTPAPKPAAHRTHHGRPVESRHHDRPAGQHAAPRHKHSFTSGGAPVQPSPAQLVKPAAPVTPPVAGARAAGPTLTHAGPAATAITVISSQWTAGVNPDPAMTAAVSRLSSFLATRNQPPLFLIAIYKAAGRRYHVPWKILAAINAIETDYGRNLNTSSAGAIGWMQFMPGTWRRYAVAADGQGPANPYNPWDAIFAAARYLAANGARRDLRGAIFAYNHANWYVEAVLLKAQAITNHPIALRDGNGYALPLAPSFMRRLGRTDDGVDIETAPDGALVYSITPGVVTAVASDPSGFGPNYPVVTATEGPLAGQAIYYGHVALSLVRPGERVTAGQPIAVIGHTGDAASLGHGHIEIGFSTTGGDPLNHHGAVAWTAAGETMRGFLVELSALYRIKNS